MGRGLIRDGCGNPGTTIGMGIITPGEAVLGPNPRILVRFGFRITGFTAMADGFWWKGTGGKFQGKAANEEGGERSPLSFLFAHRFSVLKKLAIDYEISLLGHFVVQCHRSGVRLVSVPIHPVAAGHRGAPINLFDECTTHAGAS